jgi:polyisoprenoid-binding protein YceI
MPFNLKTNKMTSLKIVLASLTFFAAAFHIADTNYLIDSSSSLTLDGSSNVNKFTCACNDQFPRNTLRLNLSQGGKIAHFSNAVLHVKTNSLDCGNPQMNKDLYQTLRADKYPHIKLELSRAHLPEGAQISYRDWSQLQAHGTLTIAGITKPIVFEVKARRHADNKLRLVAAKEVLMTDFNINPPKAMLGLIKVNNSIRLNMDLIIITQQPG